MKSIRVALFAGLLAAANASAAAPGPVSGSANDPTSGPLHGHAAGATDDAGDWVAPAFEEFLVTARVVDGTGRPVEGAVVVTAVGGKGVSDADGLVRMRIQMDPAADRLRVTAYHTAETITWTGSTIADAAAGLVDAGDIPVVMRSGCEPGWEPTFGSAVGFNGDVNALAVFDDGSGPKLYAAGEFTEIGFANLRGLAVWDGSYWKPIDVEWDNQSSSVHRVFVLDGGSGPALYVVGNFYIGADNYRFARWDGQQWTNLPPSVSMATVNTLAYFDDGDGPVLYAGGSQSYSHSGPFWRLHRWDGNEWQLLTTTNQSGHIHALAVYNGGAGSRLYVAGRFNEINGVQANSIAAWDGVEFTALGGGVTKPLITSTVNALKVLDLGSGPKLFVGGDFTAAGGTDSNYIAAWNGAAWEPIGAGLYGMSSSRVQAIAAATIDGTTVLAAAGYFLSHSDPDIAGFASWDGQSWTSLHSESLMVRTMVEMHDGENPRLFVGGSGSLYSHPIRSLAALHNGEWEAVGGDLPGHLTSLAVFDDGNGPTPYATVFAQLPQVSLLHRWNGERWEAMGGPIASQQTFAVDLRVLNDGSGDRLYMCGNFWTPTGFANNIAIWNGSEFEYLPAPTTSDIWAMEMFDNGSGPALHIGTLTGLFRLDGAAWTSLGVSGRVFALKVFDDGSGPSLYAGGEFSRASTVLGTRHIARWDGSEWHAMDEGFLGLVHAIETFDDGTGETIYAAGRFPYAINSPFSPGIAKWDGAAWVPLGSGITYSGGMPDVRRLTAFDDGTGNALYASGYLTIAGGQETIAVARWDGQDWSALSPQIQRPSGSSMYNGPYVSSMAPWIDNGVKSLVMAGRFYLPATGEQHAARWRACPPACIPDLNGDGIVDADDFFLFLQLFAAGDMRADMNCDNLIDADDFFAYLGLFAAGC